MIGASHLSTSCFVHLLHERYNFFKCISERSSTKVVFVFLTAIGTGKAGILLSEGCLYVTLCSLLCLRRSMGCTKPSNIMINPPGSFSQCNAWIPSCLPKLPESYPGTLRVLKLCLVTGGVSSCCWKFPERHSLFRSSALILRNEGKSLVTFPAKLKLGFGNPLSGMEEARELMVGSHPPSGSVEIAIHCSLHKGKLSCGCWRNWSLSGTAKEGGLMELSIYTGWWKLSLRTSTNLLDL